MLESNFEDDFTLHLIEDQLEQFCNSVRKSSFTDILTNSLDVHDYIIKDINTEDLNNDLPEVIHLSFEIPSQEINLENMLDLRCPKKKNETKSILHPARHPALIGTLTVEQRKAKIEKYLIKRKKRTWQKKIYYDCRKKVADKRLRIKGRFVTKDQIISKLGPEALKN